MRLIDEWSTASREFARQTAELADVMHILTPANYTARSSFLAVAHTRARQAREAVSEHIANHGCAKRLKHQWAYP
jgi:hypothetical protein